MSRQATVIVGLLIALAVTIGVSRAPSQTPDDRGETATVTLKVEGMTCGGCEAAVKRAAQKVDAVKKVVASHAKGTAEVTYDPTRTTPEAIAKAITEGSGFKAQAPKKSDT